VGGIAYNKLPRSRNNKATQQRSLGRGNILLKVLRSIDVSNRTVVAHMDLAHPAACSGHCASYSISLFPNHLHSGHVASILCFVSSKTQLSLLMHGKVS